MSTTRSDGVSRARMPEPAALAAVSSSPRAGPKLRQADRARELRVLDDLDEAGRHAAMAAISGGHDPTAVAREQGWVEACALLLARHRDGVRDDAELPSAIEGIVATWMGHARTAGSPSMLESPSMLGSPAATGGTPPGGADDRSPADRDRFASIHERSVAERAALATQLETITAERDGLAERLTETDRDRTASELEDTVATLAALIAQLETITAERDGLVEQYGLLLDAHAAQAEQLERLRADARRTAPPQVTAPQPENHRTSGRPPTAEAPSARPDLASPLAGAAAPSASAADGAIDRARDAWLMAIRPWREDAGRSTAQALQAMPEDERARMGHLAAEAGIWVVGVD